MIQKRSIIDIWQGSKCSSVASLFNIFPLSSFGYLNKCMDILFFFWRCSCSCDVNQNFYKMLCWLPIHLLYTDHANTKFSCNYMTEMRKSWLWQLSRRNARLIYTINKNNNKNSNKNESRITKEFEVSCKWHNFNYNITKMFFCTRLTILLPLTFSNFLGSNNPAIPSSLRLMLPKTSASVLYCFQICKNISRQF